MHPSSGSKSNSSKEAAASSILVGLLICLEDGSSIFVRNISELLPDYAALYST
jgi:hypothetical protein